MESDNPNFNTSQLSDDAFENVAELSNSGPPSYLCTVEDISDDDFDIPCSQKRLNDR